jgi:hypothetical protein
VKRWLPFIGWGFLLLAVADWIALRRGVALNPPVVLALLVAAAFAAFLLRIVQLLSTLRDGRPRVARELAELVLLGGVVIALSAGSTNWLISFQGFVILHEGQTVDLRYGDGLDAFESGPLARVDGLGSPLTLAEIELVPSGGGAFYPRSRLLLSNGDDPRRLQVDPATAAASGSLRFYQGAFGFAPHVVVVRHDETVFDRVVPFTSRLEGRRSVVFEGGFSVDDEDLAVDAEIDLGSLDDAMRGHATLVLSVTQGDVPLGRGSLQPGHFAELDRGVRVGFAGLEMWSEIDVARRNYRGWVLLGAGVALLGLVAWPAAWWWTR